MTQEKHHIRYGLKFAKGGGKLTIERLFKVLSYCPDTGVFRWKVSTARRIRVGDEAGSITEHGYRIIRIDREAHYAHRLAWFYTYGIYGTDVDHVNRDKADNRIVNLRAGDHQTNMWNTKLEVGASGFRGVWPTVTGKWAAFANVDGKRKYLGTFDTDVKAAEAYDAAVRETRGSWGRLNFPRDGEREAL